MLEAPHAGFEKACAAAGISVGMAVEVPRGGIWPGIRNAGQRGRGADDVASASREPWVDANLHLYAVERTLHPEQPAVLGYRPGESRMAPHETVELALGEARMMGGNYVLSLPARYREALLAGDEKAREAWRSLGRTGAWLKQNAEIMGRPAFPAITALVDGRAAATEIVNLLVRRNASPALASASKPPAPDPQRILALVAAGLESTPELNSSLLAHAAAGTTVVVDWSLPVHARSGKKESDRTFYSHGRGQIVAYDEAIVDPSEFALDVIDLITHRRRAIRLWNAPPVIALAARGRVAGEGIVQLVNYGSPIEQEFQVRIQGHFGKATRMHPEGGAAALAVARRGTTTEVFLNGMRRLAVVIFS